MPMNALAKVAEKGAGPEAFFVSINKLIPYARNSRTHSDEQVMQIAASIEEFGFTNPVIADEIGIVAGHGRVMAARQLYAAGKTIKLPSGTAIPAGTVPVIDCTGWSDAKRRAYIIADNKLALNAGWNEEVLALELKDLGELGFDLEVIGFDDKELAKLLADKPETDGDPEDVPEFPVVPTSKRGDVWILGKHRLVCGDSTDADDVKRCLNGVTPHLMVTDPPYGVEYDASWRGEAKTGDGKRVSLGVHAKGKVANDDRWDWSAAWALFPGDVVYCWLAGRLAEKVAGSLEDAGFVIRAQIIWRKNNFAISRGDYHWAHEPCWYAVRKNRNGCWNGDRKQSTVWDIDKPQKSETGHSTQKPIECMARPIRNNSSLGQAIYEPFAGSGTTLIAAEMEGRVCHAIEIEPKYCDVIIQRFQNTFSQDAIRESDGAKYKHIAFAKAPGKGAPKKPAGADAPGTEQSAKGQKTHPKAREKGAKRAQTARKPAVKRSRNDDGSAAAPAPGAGGEG